LEGTGRKTAVAENGKKWENGKKKKRRDEETGWCRGGFLFLLFLLFGFGRDGGVNGHGGGCQLGPGGVEGLG
jgi:hypothetical protein